MRTIVAGGGSYRGDFAPFVDLDALVLAVSGGPDSVALLLLAADWARQLEGGGPAIHVATVDHGLRAGSAAEAALVATLAADCGFPHATLVWRGDKPTTRVQERARAARYALLADHARSVGARHILTAHHADDQAETILLRLGRGSGLAGLAGMRDVTDLAPDVRLARPLLGRTKAELVAICRAMDRPFAEDPANADPRFARARLRATSRELAAMGLDRHGLTRFGRRMARADAALEAEAARMEMMLGAPPGGNAIVIAPLCGAAPEIQLRVLGRLIARCAPDAIVRLERLEHLAERLVAALDAARPLKATIAGAVLTLGRDGTLAIHREGPRRRGRCPGGDAAAKG